MELNGSTSNKTTHINGVPIPVLQIDLGQITASGYKGENPDSIADKIYDAVGKELPSGTAICFLDEADKLFQPSLNHKGVDHNALAQGNLLTMIEGSIIHGTEHRVFELDTRNTMFVFMGAFQQLRDKKCEEAKLMNELFEDDDEVKTASDAFYSDLTIDDMIKFGMLEEIAGRIGSVINFHKIGERQMKKLIERKVTEVGTELGFEVRMTKKAASEFMDIAYSNLGVRKPVSRIRELAMNAIAQRAVTDRLDEKNTVIVINGLDKVSLKSKRKSESSKKTETHKKVEICESA